MPPVPSNEAARLEELYELRILDSASEERFDRYTELASEIFGVPIAFVSLIDRHRHWVKSNCGLAVTEIPREISFCAHAICVRDLLVIPDLRADPRFAENPLVTGEPHVRFYAGAVIRGPSGQPLGTCCILDRQPRQLSAKERRQLLMLARLVSGEMQAGAELIRLREQLQQQALFDVVTGLPNHALFRDRLAEAISLAGKAARNLLVAVIRIDRFAALEDALGSHGAGRIAAEAGIRVAQAFGPACILGRWQEDEFAFLLPIAAGDDVADEHALQTLLASFATPFAAEGRSIPVNVSVGASLYPEDGAEADQLVQNAKTALRANPAFEHSRYRVYSAELKARLSRKFALETGLRSAVHGNELALAFQPKVDLSTGRICGSEALLRWQSATLGPVSPGEFIPVAEDTGLIIEIGQWALNAACEQIRSWQDAGHAALPVAVNVTSFQLRQPDFPAQVQEALRRTGLDGALITLEVTESSLVDDVEGAVAIMRELGELGVGFAIDDFGTGFSSLSYLRRMPVRALKIDRSFVSGMTASPSDARIAQAVIALAHGLGLKVTAEGVETRDQLLFLRAYQCDELQGYLFSRPIPPEQLGDMLAQARKLEF